MLHVRPYVLHEVWGPCHEGTHRVKEELRLCGTNLAARQGQSQDQEFLYQPDWSGLGLTS